MRTSALALFIGATLFIAGAEPVVATEIEDFVDTWLLQQQRFEAVRFEFQGSYFQPEAFRTTAGADGEPTAQPASDSNQPHSGELLFDFVGGRLRRHRTGTQSFRDRVKKTNVVCPLHETVVFDGERFKSYAPRDLNLGDAVGPNLHAIELNLFGSIARMVPLELFHNPLLHTCGIIHIDLNFNPAELRPRLRPNQFRIVGHADVDGANCALLRSVPNPQGHYYEFLVDAADPRMIRRCMGYGLQPNFDGPWFTLETEFKDTEFGPIPSTWRVLRHESATGKSAVHECVLTDFEANPKVDDSMFNFDPPPGTLVYDETLPKESRQYVIGHVNEPNIPLGEHLLQTEERQQTAFWSFVAVAILGVCAIIVGATVYRRRRSN